MGTVLVYLVLMAAVATLVYLAASMVFGRGEQLAPMGKSATPTWLPPSELAGEDLRVVRFQQVARGYRMTEVDWVLERAATELDALRERIAELEAERAGQEADQ